jgi:hypothetical protein
MGGRGVGERHETKLLHLAVSTMKLSNFITILYAALFFSSLGLFLISKSHPCASQAITLKLAYQFLYVLGS